MTSECLSGVWERSREDIKSINLHPPKLLKRKAAKGLICLELFQARLDEFG